VDDHGVERVVGRVRAVEGQPQLAQATPDTAVAIGAGGTTVVRSSCRHLTSSA
jgi:hypothetical protein